MRHSYIDEHSDINSFIHSLEPRIKIIGFFAFILFVIFTPLDFRPASFLRFCLYAIFMGVLVFLSRVPPLYIFRRSLSVIPFVLVIAVFIPFLKTGRAAATYSLGALKFSVTYAGLVIFWSSLVKSYLSIISMILLSSTTRFYDLLNALQKLGLPSVFIMVISFMYRYIFVIADEAMAMQQAKESRSVRASGWLHLKVLGNIIGVLFIRAYERAENVYLAMCARGFDAKARTLHSGCLRPKDLCFLFVLVSVLLGIRILEMKNG